MLSNTWVMISIDPAHVGAPAIAGQSAAVIAVDPVIGGIGVGIRIGAAAGVGSQPNPADILGPDIAFQMIPVHGDISADGGVEINPARVRTPGPFGRRVHIGG